MFLISHHALFVRSDSIVLFEGKYSLLFELWFTYVVYVYRYNSSAGESIVLLLCFIFALLCFVCCMFDVLYVVFVCFSSCFDADVCIYFKFVCLFLWWVVDCCCCCLCREVGNSDDEMFVL